MIEYFNDKIKQDAIKHAKKEYPNESCGIVVNNTYMGCENEYEDPSNGFKINKNTILKAYRSGNFQAIIHSHCDLERPLASQYDMERQEKSGIPWGIVDLYKRSVRQVFFFGDQLPIQDLYGRPFIHGVYDCFGLVRDYYRTKGYNIPNFPREWAWWKNGENVILENVEKAGFEIIDPDKIQHEDIVISRIRFKYPNHCGIFFDNGVVLHHWASKNSLSCEIPYNTIRKYITYGARYKYE